MSQLFTSEGPAPINGRKIMLATTAYENPDASYTASIQASRESLHKAGIPSAYLLLSGNCHVDDARNTVVRHFLASDCSDLVFIDADVSWEAPDLVKLCRYDVDMVGAVYPYRDPIRREDMPCRTLAGVTEPDERGLLEMDGLPTGFLRINRRVFDVLAPTTRKYRVTSEPTETMPVYFERGEVAESDRRSGDLFFCWKARQAGVRLWADPEMILGHAAKVVVKGSLGAALRRQRGQTLKWVCDRIRAGTEAHSDYKEAWDALDNKFAAAIEVLASAVMLAREGKGHVIEAGSGLSTILMAAALPPGKYVYAMEHDPVHAGRLMQLARIAGVNNIGLIEGMRDGWYDLRDADLPGEFALGFLDGPPRVFGTRMKFFDEFGHRCRSIVVDDADGADYATKLVDWSREHGADVSYMSGRLAIIKPARIAAAA